MSSVFSDAFGNEQGSKNRLLNILMNLRKCVDHPYLFDGEMEPPWLEFCPRSPWFLSVSRSCVRGGA